MYRGAKKGWVGPYIMLSTDGINVTVQRGTNRSEFRVNFVKPYNRLESTIALASGLQPFEYPAVEIPRPRGRPATVSVPTTFPDNQSSSPFKKIEVPPQAPV